MQRLTNTVQHYAWGSVTALADLEHRDPSGRPEAEVWMGAHRSAPSRLADGQDLASYIAADPIGTLGVEVAERFGATLPFLLKLLAAAQPLSIQAHPSRAAAIAGFAAENEAGLALDAPDRNYRDGNHKPELICALGHFEALCGFRPVEESAALFADLGLSEWSARLADDGIASTVAAMLGGRFDAAVNQATRGSDLAARLASFHPGDSGVLVALLLNHVILEPGEAIYLGAGNLHAYIAGIGVEVMANSDNVLRGGLTTKHADVHELLSVISCEPGRPPVQRPDASGRYRTPAEEFELSVITTATVSGPAIALCTAGTLNVAGELLQAGESAFIRADEQVGLAADGQSHVATVGTLIGSTPG